MWIPKLETSFVENGIASSDIAIGTDVVAHKKISNDAELAQQIEVAQHFSRANTTDAADSSASKPASRFFANPLVQF